MSNRTTGNWSVSDVSKPTFSGAIEFQDVRGEWHGFEIIATRERVVFGSCCNVGFFESGYLLRDEAESLDESLQETYADLETYYNAGSQYVSRIVCNERM